MSQYRTKCLQCKTITHRIRSLLNELSDIKKTEGDGVCEYCKLVNPSGKCRRCACLVNKSICCKVDQHDNKGVFESWLNKVKSLLQSILECEKLCWPKPCKEPTSLNEIEKLLRELRSPLPMRQPDISYMMDSGNFNSLKTLTQGQNKGHKKKRSPAKSPVGLHPIFSIDQYSSVDIKLEKNPSKIVPLKAQTISQQTKSNKKTDTVVTDKSTTSSLPKLSNRPISSSRDRKKKKRNKSQKNLHEFSLPSLPAVFEKTSKHSVVNESVVECETAVSGPREMIKGTVLVQANDHKDEPQTGVVPLLYKVDTVFCDTVTDSNSITSSIKSKYKEPNKKELGGFLYKLSDPAFIAKGWTMLPTTKLLKKINIYKMKPAYPQFDWFEHHKTKKNMFYGSGEKLAEFFDDGHGRLFYKNGAIAMNYYRTGDMNEGQRCIVYDSDDDVIKKKIAAHAILASFDYVGNGIVYDKHGSERLKYNQSEGALYDAKIAPPTHWLWNSLNCPPEMNSICIDTFVRDRSLHNLICKEKYFTDGEVNTQMTEVKRNYFEKDREFFKKCKPFQIRTKAFKINDQFSLRLLDQANIYLLFRDGPISFKFNLGMKFIDTEIIGSEIAEATDVALSRFDLPNIQSKSVVDNMYRDHSVDR